MKLLRPLVIIAILAGVLAAPALAKQPYQSQHSGPTGYYVYPPRFQIYTAPEPYGGLVMLDTQTGETYQRVIVNTPKGINIRWIKVPRTPPKPEETILWK